MSTTRTSRSLPWVATLVVGTLVVLATVLLLQARDSQPSSELAAVQRACEEWMAEDADGAGSVGTCRRMVAWMGGQRERSGMGPGTMMGTPGQLRERCEAWMAAPPPSDDADVPRADDPARGDWCRQMTDWMSAHADRWAPDHMREGWRSPDR
jgi:hypothetical protein